MAVSGTQDGEALGLIAGDGQLPVELARAASAQGRRVHAIGFRDLTQPDLEKDVDQLSWMFVGEVGKLIESLHRGGVRDVVLAGKVSKSLLFESGSGVRLDERAQSLLTSLHDRSDDSILDLLARELETEGLHLRHQAEYVPDLVVGIGPLGAVTPSASQLSDIRCAWDVAKTLGAAGVGQTVVVERGAVLAVEAIEGTDAAIRRGGALSAGSASVVKVARPGQDLRFDLPVIGNGTLETMKSAGIGALACEAGHTLVLQREQLVAKANAAGIALVGIAPGGVEVSSEGPGMVRQ